MNSGNSAVAMGIRHTEGNSWAFWKKWRYWIEDQQANRRLWSRKYLLLVWGRRHQLQTDTVSSMGKWSAVRRLLWVCLEEWELSGSLLHCAQVGWKCELPVEGEGGGAGKEEVGSCWSHWLNDYYCWSPDISWHSPISFWNPLPSISV